MRLNSLSFRLFVSAAVWALIVLPIAGYVLVSQFQDAVERSFNARLSVYLTTLIASSTVGADGRIEEPPAVGEPVFTIPFSGWYWQVRRLGDDTPVKASSESLADAVITPLWKQGVEPNKDLVREGYMKGPNGQNLKAVEREITFGEGDSAAKYSFTVTGNVAEIEADISNFTATLVSALAVLGLGLVLATFFQVRFGLAPLRAIGAGLAAIRSGKAANLEGEFPAEIEPLQKELNALIQSNNDIVERARTHVGNLAHALKTPLSVVSNEAESTKSPLARKVLEQTVIMRDQITHYLDRARMAARVNLVGSVTQISPVIESLTRALSRIHDDKAINLVGLSTELKFRGERQDLEEMIGNLLDNACKWAERQVTVVVSGGPGSSQSVDAVVVITIEDDGPGLSAEERALAVKRGKRLDETKPGSGLGLSIVADLVHLYQGEFALEHSSLGGLKAQLTLPQA